MIVQAASRLLRGALTRGRMRGISTGLPLPSAYEGDGKTTVSILNQEVSNLLLIDAYSTMGFVLNNGINVVGSVALFPRTVLSWQVASVDDINEESLSLFYMLEPRLDVLVIGTGDRGTRLNLDIIKFLRSKRLNVEAVPTESACATFNYLNADGRLVGAGLIPPSNVAILSEDAFEAQRRRKQLYKLED
ncbi:unnamed protein product [Darwinula stevensoni]|uniref:NADH dehydrogenase [ubiquinone] 1 alpha subcomplex assembly factor 3 n=1 Tax=Darwinula stevensoni TaxID=69355 RepID=A0A7R9FPS5_9CRUS|nr:unnamed protein product [Darwinula stevensoni]CAG0898416.1 unnamed protein product [Darwinula stevensoni]